MESPEHTELNRQKSKTLPGNMQTNFVLMILVGLSGCGGQDLSPGNKADFSEAVRSADARPAAHHHDQPATRVNEAMMPVDERKLESRNRISDVAVTAKVRSALIVEPGLKSLSIEVKSAGGVVTLSGTTETNAASDQAARVASAVAGVKSVRSHLTATGS